MGFACGKIARALNITTNTLPKQIATPSSITGTKISHPAVLRVWLDPSISARIQHDSETPAQTVIGNNCRTGRSINRTPIRRDNLGIMTIDKTTAFAVDVVTMMTLHQSFGENSAKSKLVRVQIRNAPEIHKPPQATAIN